MEAIFASFLLITSILIGVLVFDASLQAEASNEQRTMAALVAENALEEVRSAANQRFTNLKAEYDGKTWTLPGYSEFAIKAKVDEQLLPIPCTELENQYPLNPAFPAPERRTMKDSAWRCEVSVDWSRGQGESVTIVQYMANLNQVTTFELQIQPGGGNRIDDLTTGTFPVARNGTLDFSVTATADGAPVSDVQFTWYVEPLDGFGSVYRVSREGDLCRYKNYYRNYDGTIRFGPGLCDLVVRGVYQGIEAKRKVRINNG